MADNNNNIYLSRRRRIRKNPVRKLDQTRKKGFSKRLFCRAIICMIEHSLCRYSRWLQHGAVTRKKTTFSRTYINKFTKIVYKRWHDVNLLNALSVLDNSLCNSTFNYTLSLDARGCGHTSILSRAFNGWQNFLVTRNELTFCSQDKDLSNGCHSRK